MEALVNSAASRATRLLVRLVRTAFLLSLTVAVVLLFIRHWQHGSASVPQGGILLFVAGSVSMAMIALRTDLFRQLVWPVAGRGAIHRGGPPTRSMQRVRWRWMLSFRGQVITCGIHVCAAICWGMLGKSPSVLLSVILITFAAEVICWLPWVVAQVEVRSLSSTVETPVTRSTHADSLEQPSEPVARLLLDDSAGVGQPDGDRAVLTAAPESPFDEASEECCVEESIDADLVQFQERRRGDESVSIQGLIRVPVTRDQRTVIEHVVFHPPLPAIPEVEFDWLEGPECQIRVTRAETFGLRFELRLNRNPTQSGSIVFQYLATAACMEEQGKS